MVFGRFFKEVGVKNAVTLFHSPSVPASTRILTLLMQANATSASGATEDQASAHDAHNAAQKRNFELDVSEKAPTSDQLKSILEYVGEGKEGSVVENASDAADAQRRVRLNEGSLRRPIVVDWNSGTVIVGDKEIDVKKMLDSHKE